MIASNLIPAASARVGQYIINGSGVILVKAVVANTLQQRVMMVVIKCDVALSDNDEYVVTEGAEMSMMDITSADMVFVVTAKRAPKDDAPVEAINTLPMPKDEFNV